MSSSKVQLIGGAFQDAEGNLLVNGYLKMRLSQDSSVNTSQVASGVELTIQLDSAGNVASSSSTPPAANQLVWGNDQLSPVNSFYRVTGYKSNGQPAWGPNNQQVIGNGGTFDVGTWVPNKVVDWTPPLQPLDLEVNGTPNVNQSILNLVDSATVTFTDNGDGSVSAAAVGGFTLSDSNWFTSLDSIGGTGSMSTDSRMVDGISAGGGCPAVQINIDVPITIRKISINVITAHASSHGMVAIYSADGTTKLLDAGNNAFDTSLTGVLTVTLGSSFNLPAGSYLIAWQNDGGNSNVRVVGADTSSNGLTIDWLNLLNANKSRYVRATNGISGGNMPSSLGSLTVPNSGQRFDIVAVLFE